MKGQDNQRSRSDSEGEGTQEGINSVIEMPCFQCGICCSVYQVRIEMQEAQAIAAHMGFELYDWVGRYCDPRWRGTTSFLIRHEGDGCVFLLPDAEKKIALCSIHGVRPSSCREWVAGLHKPECREGLRSCWRITVSSDGRMEGSPKALAAFDEFLGTLG